MFARFDQLLLLSLACTFQLICVQDWCDIYVPKSSTTPNMYEKYHASDFAPRSSRLTQNLNYLPPKDTNDTWGVVLPIVSRKIKRTIIALAHYFYNRQTSPTPAVYKDPANQPDAPPKQPDQHVSQQNGALTRQQLIAYATRKFENQREQLIAYERDESILVYESLDTQSELYNRITKRVESLQKVLYDSTTIQEFNYALTPQTKKLLEQYIPESIHDIEHFVGNELQYTLHGECIEILNGIAYDKPAFDRHYVTEATIRSVDAGYS